MSLARNEIQHDLRLYADLLSKADISSLAFDNVLDTVSNAPYLISLHEFIEIMRHVPLTPESTQRLDRVRELDVLVHPHMPEFVAFAELWACVARPEALEWVNVESTATGDAVRELFEPGIGERLEELEDSCVIYRTAVAMRDLNLDGDQRIDNDPSIPVQLALHQGTATVKEMREAYDDAMENFDGNPESYPDLPAYPHIPSTACSCVSAFRAIENLLTSRELFAPEPPNSLKMKLECTRDSYWSTLHGTEAAMNEAMRSEDFFTFSTQLIDTHDNWEYLIAFAIGDVMVSFTSRELHPQTDADAWREVWDERTDMFQYLMDAAAFREEKRPWQKETKPNRTFVWSFIERPEYEPETQSQNALLVWNADKNAYDQHFPLGFSDGFFLLKELLRNEGNGGQ